MKSLRELAYSYGSDKGLDGSLKPKEKKKRPQGGGHNYVDIYEAYFSQYRLKKLCLLEIGLGAVGASMNMWKEYFPNSQLYGLDINPHFELDDCRTATRVIDQSSQAQLESFLNEFEDIQFDFIIDDGSHKPYDQQLTFQLLFPRLKAGGIYFIEDLLPNGKGDTMNGPMSSPEVLNTRSIFKAFQAESTFIEPHALGDTTTYQASIDQVNFHSPRISMDLIPRASLKRPFTKKIRYLPDSENLVAILKKGPMEL